MKILFTSHLLDLSGAPRSLLNLIESTPIEHERHCVAFYGGSLETRFRKSFCSLNILSDAPKLSKGGRIFDKIIGSFKFLFLLIKSRPDVVLINTAASLRAQIICFSLRIPYVVYVREFDEMIADRLLTYRKRALSLANHIIAVSKANSEWVRTCGVPPSRITVIHNGICREKIVALSMQRKSSLSCNSNKIIKVGICGSMSYRKGFDIFIAAAANLLQDNSNIRFFVIGDYEENNPSFKNNCIAEINSLNITEYFQFTGFLENPYPEINDLDILCMPSRQESLPRVVMESVCLQIPVVAFNVGGTNELLPLDYPYLVDEIELSAFCRTLRSVTLSIGDLEEVILSYAKLDSEFSQDVTINKLCNILYKTKENK